MRWALRSLPTQFFLWLILWKKGDVGKCFHHSLTIQGKKATGAVMNSSQQMAPEIQREWQYWELLSDSSHKWRFCCTNGSSWRPIVWDSDRLSPGSCSWVTAIPGRATGCDRVAGKLCGNWLGLLVNSGWSWAGVCPGGQCQDFLASSLKTRSWVVIKEVLYCIVESVSWSQSYWSPYQYAEAFWDKVSKSQGEAATTAAVEASAVCVLWASYRVAVTAAATTVALVFSWVLCVCVLKVVHLYSIFAN